ncbi:hypothetical protein FRACYDRAFT_262121 [Fragilariopsis cylindrus CCMP1102]|uniref:Uncharacterized protein n=1 Tax=Fragilariopsis cylindrus CCMP1102 TaxID=635003 RepID=A0A1E7F9P3_9STRA|nr:hypothetical protein FRACYDRAFT_262121 [Fragilariopsis cylindrus CCMP1102]|eukprot:OEU14866.1 hypothetical protein FRACYDRAFT_262121 [Fragilariopsis cylindrus CCMP1102]
MMKQDDGSEATAISASSVQEVLEELQIETTETDIRDTEKISNSSSNEKDNGDIGTDTGTHGEVAAAAAVSIQEEKGADVAVEGTETMTTEEEEIQHAGTAAELYIEPVWSVVYASNPGVTAILQEGDHLIRWEMLPIIYPIQIHAIVMEVTEVYVKLVDFGRTAVPDHDDTPATEQEQEQKVDLLHKYLVKPLSFGQNKNNNTTTSDSKTSSSSSSSSGSTKNKTKKIDRLNIKILTTVEELKPWSKVNYSGGGLFGGTTSPSEEKDGGKKITASTTTKKKWLGGYFGTTKTKKRSSALSVASSSNDHHDDNGTTDDDGNNEQQQQHQQEVSSSASFTPMKTSNLKIGQGRLIKAGWNPRVSTVSSRASSSFGCIEEEEEGKEEDTAMKNDNDSNGNVNVNNEDDNDSTTSSNDCVIDGTDNIAPGDGVEESKEAETTVDACDHTIDDHQNHHHENGTDSEERKTVSTKSQEDFIKDIVEHKQQGGKGKGGLLGFGLIPSRSSGQSNVNSSNNNITNKDGDHKKRASSMASMKSFFTLKINETHDGDTTHDNHNDKETKGPNPDGKRTSSKFMNPAMVKLMQSNSGDDDSKTKKKPHSSVLSKDAKEQLSKLPKDDPTKLVLARVCFLLDHGETVLPPYNVFHSNSETIAVWCKTGSFKTIQADVFLYSTAIGNGKSAMAIGIGVAAASGVAAAGVAGIGVAAVVAPWWYLTHSKDKCYDATTSLNDTFWSQAEPEVFVDCIQKWSRTNNNNNSDAVDKIDEEEDEDDDDVLSAMTATTNAITTAASTVTTKIES